MDAQDRRAAHLSVKLQHQIGLGHCYNQQDYCLSVQVIPAVLLPRRYNLDHNPSPERNTDEDSPHPYTLPQSTPRSLREENPTNMFVFSQKRSNQQVPSPIICAPQAPYLLQQYVGVLFGQGTILDSVVIVGVVALGISKISVLHMAKTANPEHRWACWKIMQKNKVHTVRKIEIGAVIMAAKEPPMQTMPSANTKHNKKKSLTSKLQIEIPCSCQKISAIIDRYKHRKGGGAEQTEQQQQKSRNITTNSQLNFSLG